MSDAPPTIVLALSCPPSLNMLWRHPPGYKRPVRSQEYSTWLRSAGWEAKSQLVGIATIAGTFNAELLVPEKSRRDRDSWTKAIFDLCEHVGAIRNDSGLRTYTVIGADRDDCLVSLWDMGGPEMRAPRVYPVSVHKKRATAGAIRRAHQAGLWR